MKSFRPKVVVPLILFVAVIGIFRAPLRNQILERGTLSNDAPVPEVLAEMIEHSGDPHAALLATWNAGGIVHRETAMAELPRVFPNQQPLPPDVNAWLLSAALDPDLNVRETAFGILRERQHPALLALAAGQLHDVDLAVRLLGLIQFKDAPAAAGVPVVAALLDDPDAAVAGMSVKFLESWAGQSFGVKLADTVMVQNQVTGLEEFSEAGMARTRAAAAKAKVWWAQHQGEFPPAKLEMPVEALAARPPLPAGDFELRTLDGKNFRLADFRGKVVLINFWTTWCPACVGEMPELVALQKQQADNLVITGVSLDDVPDEDGAVGGEAAGQKLDQNDRPAATALLEQIRARVVRTVAARGLNYPVLLDENNEVGARFNGGELPTTVIVDARGNIRRRFIGTRSLSVFEAMIREAGQNPSLVPLASSDRQAEPAR